MFLILFGILGSRTWVSVDTTDDMDYVLTGLSEGKSYSMRVAAQNEVGVGAFAEIPTVVPKSQYSECISMIFVLVISIINKVKI